MNFVLFYSLCRCGDLSHRVEDAGIVAKVCHKVEFLKVWASHDMFRGDEEGHQIIHLFWQVGAQCRHSG